jgi:hypothetical protein
MFTAQRIMQSYQIKMAALAFYHAAPSLGTVNASKDNGNRTFCERNMHVDAVSFRFMQVGVCPDRAELVK